MASHRQSHDAGTNRRMADTHMLMAPSLEARQGQRRTGRVLLPGTKMIEQWPM